MNSTERKQELIKMLEELKNNPKTSRIRRYEDHIVGRCKREVLDSILFQCLDRREEIEAMRKRWHGAFSPPEIKAVKDMDYSVGCSMDDIWFAESSWCAELDFEPNNADPWYHVKFICEELIDVITYAEEKYGVFQILDITTLRQ